MSTLQVLMGRAGARPSGAPTSPDRAEPTTKAEQIRRFDYHGNEREFMGSAAREAMLLLDIEAYTRDNRRAISSVWSWARLVCQKDEALFGSSHILADVNRADCVCPTAEEVAALAADMADA
ncbi:hypothetical protein PtA15_12A377 [Puccinia triticina]|uniref:Uncharacterized protein n=1 Tax=Puccinia triticina TaxID=208348 RepID=A0ABY7D1B4_9BASI|nr:uncharacterized protein PtA15_12A377 [Puccinia triticina]WAQ90388.1 hypothetical protein PtA15_12A377 [Puccinia triticina]WAR61702.1 hypothetical protein PtB15_12B392 [Puccinia triticina]